MKKFAVVKDGVVVNVIQYDQMTIEDNLVNYNNIFENYKTELANSTAKIESAMTKLYDIEHEIKFARDMEKKTYIAKRKEIEQIIQNMPTKPLEPNKPLAEYTPPEGCELIEIDDSVGIGFSYVDSKFIDTRIIL